MKLSDHQQYRLRDLAEVKRVVGNEYVFVCVESVMSSEPTTDGHGDRLVTSSVWASALTGEMAGYYFYVYVTNGLITRSVVNS